MKRGDARYSLGTQVHERYEGYMWLPRSRSTSLSNVWERDCVEDSCVDFLMSFPMLETWQVREGFMGFILTRTSSRTAEV